VHRILAHLSDKHWLMVSLLYGSGQHHTALRKQVRRARMAAGINTTEIYTHVPGRGAMGVISPVDS